MEHQVWLNKAAENLAAQLCFEHGQCNACANRLYYAMFHTALGHCSTNGFNHRERQFCKAW